MTSMDFHWNFLEKLVESQFMLLNIILNKLVSNVSWVVQIKCGNSFFRKSVASKWAKTVLRFINIISNHNWISEISVLHNHSDQISSVENKAKFTTCVKTDAIGCIRIFLTISIKSFDLRLQTFVSRFDLWNCLGNINVNSVEIFFHISYKVTGDKFGFARGSCVSLLILTMFNHIKKTWSFNNDFPKLSLSVFDQFCVFCFFFRFLFFFTGVHLYFIN